MAKQFSQLQRELALESRHVLDFASSSGMTVELVGFISYSCIEQ